MGAVGKPGRYAFEESLSFLDIISAADGPTNAADLLNIRVAHRGEGRDRVSRVNLARYFETGDETLLPRVRPGDVIFVPDRNRNWLEQSPGSTVRVLGAVNRPGRYQFTDGMSILDLLAEAGGPNRDALQERIVVVNLSCCADQARSFDLPAFARSGDVTRLPIVRAGDTVYVPTSAQSDWRLFFDSVRDIVTMLSVIALLGRI
jgi:protein involved in polysaccharide export with SLBB domain